MSTKVCTPRRTSLFYFSLFYFSLFSFSLFSFSFYLFISLLPPAFFSKSCQMSTKVCTPSITSLFITLCFLASFSFYLFLCFYISPFLLCISLSLPPLASVRVAKCVLKFAPPGEPAVHLPQAVVQGEVPLQRDRNEISQLTGLFLHI